MKSKRGSAALGRCAGDIIKIVTKRYRDCAVQREKQKLTLLIDGTIMIEIVTKGGRVVRCVRRSD